METKTTSGNFSLTTWSLGSEQLKYQVDNYQTLGLWKSSRGASLMVVLFSNGITVLFAAIGVFDWATAIGPVVLYLPMGLLIYKGYVWPNIVVMVLWSADKALQIITRPGAGIVIVLLWWAAFMSVFYKSYQVGKERRKPVMPQIPVVPTPAN